MAKTATVWTQQKLDLSGINSATTDLRVIQTEVLDQPVGHYTIRRIVGSISARLSTLSTTAGFLWFGFHNGQTSIDVADYSATDWDSDIGARWIYPGAINLTGIGGDSSAAINLRPFTVERFDTKVMRKIGQGNQFHLVLHNELSVQIEFQAWFRMLWSRTLGR